MNWIKVYLIRKGSLWSIKDKTQAGSWMWHTMLKLIEVTKLFYKKELGNRRHTSFGLINGQIGECSLTYWVKEAL